MSYLGTLIATARGRPQGLQPRLAARFENLAPAPEPEAADGPLRQAAPAVPPAVPATAPRTTIQQHAAPHPNGRRQPAPTPTENPTAAREVPPPTAPWQLSETRPAAASQAQEPGPAAAIRPNPLAPPAPVPQEPRDAAAIVATAERPVEASTAPPWLSTAPKPIAQPTPPLPVAAPAPPARPGPRSPAIAEAPTVRISIGRVDVRADPTPAKAAARPAAARPTGDSSLTRYLNQRGRP